MPKPRIRTGEAVKAELDKVAKGKFAVEAGTDGRVTAGIGITRRGWTFGGYLKALLVGPEKGISGGVRVERDF